MVESTPSIVTAQVHCIEPLPITNEVLQKATSLTNYASKGLQIHGTAISSENGTVYFPKPTQREDLLDFEKVEVGTENKGIGSCARMDEQEKQKHCVPVSVTTLDSFSEKQLPEDSIVNYILTDVEGYDFDVLLGAQNTLRRTEYLEFEFNWKERWALPDRSLTKTVEFLDNLDFTCYWAGINKLWRITNCLLPHYNEAKFWSNVACVNRRLAAVLASEMENLFLKTIQK
jgi:FkbM family methyltransferase